MPRVRVREYAGLRLWPSVGPYVGWGLSLGRGRRRRPLSDDGAENRPRKRKPSLFNDA